MRLVIGKWIECDRSHKLLCTPINTDGTTLSQNELMDNALFALQNLRCLYGEFGHPYKQSNQNNEDYLKRCLEVDMTQVCISFQGFTFNEKDGKIVILFEFVGGQRNVFEKVLRNNTVDLGSRAIITDSVTYITFDVIQKLT